MCDLVTVVLLHVDRSDSLWSTKQDYRVRTWTGWWWIFTGGSNSFTWSMSDSKISRQLLLNVSDRNRQDGRERENVPLFASWSSFLEWQQTKHTKNKPLLSDWNLLYFPAAVRNLRPFKSDGIAFVTRLFVASQFDFLFQNQLTEKRSP